MAISASERHLKDSILITGATGALGSELLPIILRNGYDVVCLVRAPDAISAQRRIEAVIGRDLRVRVIRGDITEPRCGITDLDCQQLLERGVARIFHCAASINFEDRDATYRANVHGVQNVIDLANFLHVSQLFHVSTTYVAGEAKTLCETDQPDPTRFQPRNAYEITKQIGETMIRSWGLNEDRRYTILRPSVLVGRQDGSSPSFDGFYRYFMPIDSIAESMRGRNDLPPDIHVDTDGWVDTQLAILMANLGINYVPLDWCARTMAQLLEVPPRNETFHIVHHNPLQMLAGLRWALERLKLRARIVGTPEEKTAVIATQSRFLRRKQRQMDVVHDPYLPYCTTSPQFEMSATPRVLNGKFRRAPDINRAFIHRMIDFAKSRSWGAQKQAAAAE